jgi:ubiquinone/menaquinone biosynthesis C-methylase UbiE
MKGLRPALLARFRRFTYLVPAPLARVVKGRAEVFFWRAELERYVSWYYGGKLYGLPPPTPEQRVTGHSPEVNAATTFLRVVQYPRYLGALALDADALEGERVLDVGCGPLPNLLVFAACERHGIDPLVDRYRQAGYPLELWEREGFTYHHAPAERMPFPDAYFDTVVSVNAVDHVDDFAAVAREIRRVLRPGGRLRLQINYHRPTVTEPVSLDDEVIRRNFAWVPRLAKLRDEPHPAEAGERLTLWASDAGGPEVASSR